MNFVTVIKGEIQPNSVILGDCLEVMKHIPDKSIDAIITDLLREQGYRPVFLFLREDNLPAAMTACQVGGWSVYNGMKTFEYLKEKTGFDLYKWLCFHRDQKTFFINRG